MAYVPYTDATRDIVTDKPERKRTGFFRRLVNAMYVSRQLRVASVARYLPSTTRMSRSTLPVPSALSASL